MKTITTTFSWEQTSLSTFDESDFCYQLSEITEDGFGVTMNFNIPDVMFHANKNNIRYTLRDSKGEISGFFFGNVSEQIFYLSKVCISQKVQSQGYGHLLFNELMTYNNSDVKLICAISQNPGIIKLMRKFGGKIFPFDESYSSVLGLEILLNLTSNGVINQSKLDKIELSTGIIRDLYQKKLGIYKYNKQDNSELNRERGDAFLISILKDSI